MSAGGTAYEIDDAKSFDDNIDAFAKVAEASDPALGAALKQCLKDVASGSISYAEVWDALLDAAAAPSVIPNGDSQETDAGGGR